MPTTFQDLVNALNQLENALAAEDAAARALNDATRDADAKEKAFLNVLEDYRPGKGGVSPDARDSLVQRLKGHAERLESLVGPDGGSAVPPSQEAPMPPLDEAMRRIDADTTAVAGVINDLRGKLSTGMSQQDVDEAKNTLAAIADRLEAVAKDPNNPIPPQPIPPPAAIKRK